MLVSGSHLQWGLWQQDLLPSDAQPCRSAVMAGCVSALSQVCICLKCCICCGCLPLLTADKPYKSAWRMACWVTDRRSDEPVLRNRCPTMSGQSGAPMVEQRRSRDGSNSMQYVVRAVVSHEVCKAVCGMTCCPKMSSYNGAVKITRHFKRFIDKNRNQRPYEPSRRRRL